MVTATFSDSGSVRSWRGINNERVALLLYDESLPLERSSLTLTSNGGVCVFSSPPFCDDPEVIIVQLNETAIGDAVIEEIEDDFC